MLFLATLGQVSHTLQTSFFNLLNGVKMPNLQVCFKEERECFQLFVAAGMRISMNKVDKCKYLNYEVKPVIGNTMLTFQSCV